MGLLDFDCKRKMISFSVTLFMLGIQILEDKIVVFNF